MIDDRTADAKKLEPDHKRPLRTNAR